MTGSTTGKPTNPATYDVIESSSGGCRPHERTDIPSTLIGRYQNASEVLREGLRLIEQREAEDAAKLEALRRAADLGIADLQSGSFKEFADPDAFRRYLEGIVSHIPETGETGELREHE